MHEFPSTDVIARLLTDLLGRRVVVRAHKGASDNSGPSIAASYADADGKVWAESLVDYEASASLGAALSMLPPSRVEEAVDTREFDGMLLENFREVCNVMVSLLNDGGGPPLSLHSIQTNHEPASPDESAVEMTVAVEGYGEGCMSLVRTP